MSHKSHKSFSLLWWTKSRFERFMMIAYEYLMKMVVIIIQKNHKKMEKNLGNKIKKNDFMIIMKKKELGKSEEIIMIWEKDKKT